jgi:endonuclease/exonuclease/phosphatase family metal-dependent hydrolase
MFFINIICVLFLLFSYFASYISPEGKFWWLQFFGLAYGPILIINFFFIIFWLFAGRKRMWLSALAILVGIGRIFAIAQPFNMTDGKKAVDEGNPAIKVMTFNVHVFNLYDWKGNEKKKDEILNFLRKESPDVVCFQEYYTSESGAYRFNMNDTLKAIIPAEYSHIEYTTTLHGDKDHWGIATFSKYPVVNKQAIRFRKKGRNLFLATDILAGNDTIRIINTHLESIRFKEEDYKFVSNIGGENEEEIAGSMSILRKMKRAYSKRALQVGVLKNEIAKSPYPVIVCGDFNDTPNSYTYSQLTDGLKDSFRESGTGFGQTYAGVFPSFRIDYILHDSRLLSTNYTTHKEDLSDHYPVSCTISVNK